MADMIAEPVPATETQPTPAAPTGKPSYIWGVGRRKSAVARVRVAPGSGKIEINGRTLNDYFTAEADRKAIFGPLEVTNTGGKMCTKGTVAKIIGMTAMPEARLAREAELCYAQLAMVTDYDVWHVSEAPVTVEMVIQTLNKNTAIAQEAVRVLAGQLTHERHCECGHALATALITHKDAIPAGTRQKLDLLVNKYL